MSSAAGPIVRAQAPPFVSVAGCFYRAVAAGGEAAALGGSRGVGRFARDGGSVLYLSSSRNGVIAAMQRHGGLVGRVVVAVAIEVDRIVDLGDGTACDVAGVRAADAAADWRMALAAGEEPASWRVADRLRAIGARGLIDPSRAAPGLWHLVLFAWDGARVIG